MAGRTTAMIVTNTPAKDLAYTNFTYYSNVDLRNFLVPGSRLVYALIGDVFVLSIAYPFDRAYIISHAACARIPPFYVDVVSMLTVFLMRGMAWGWVMMGSKGRCYDFWIDGTHGGAATGTTGAFESATGPYGTQGGGPTGTTGAYMTHEGAPTGTTGAYRTHSGAPTGTTGAYETYGGWTDAEMAAGGGQLRRSGSWRK